MAETSKVIAERRLDRVIHLQALQTPDAPAVHSHNGHLTYNELNSLSRRLAAHLRQLGVAPGTLVPVLFEKSCWAIVAMLAILKAGAAYVPLDASHSDERLRETIKDGKASIVVTSPSQQSRFSSLATPVTVSPESLFSLPLQSKVDDEEASSESLNDTMYVVYTSGSTGKPKGVIISHRTFITSARAHGSAQNFNSSSRVLQFASYAFDASIQEIFTTLVFGGCVCIAGEEDRRGNISQYVKDAGVNLAVLTPSFVKLLEPAELPTLKTLVLCGEPVPSALIATWSPHVELMVGYGPSEAAICSAVAKSLSADNTPTGIIGCGVGCTLHIVNPDNHDEKIADVEAEGELLIEGGILARGYLNDDEKTNSSFIINPAWAQPVEGEDRRFYKTGDLVRSLPTGELVFAGRKDTQIKLHGQRFELEEIEHHLSGILHDAKGVCVDKVLLPSDQEALVAFISTSTSTSTQSPLGVVEDGISSFLTRSAEIKTGLAKTIPATMVPSIYIPLNLIPLSTSGKMDRGAIREFAKGLDMGRFRSYRVPAGEATTTLTSVESNLRTLWAKVLGVEAEAIHLHDNFLEIGGDSISTIKLVASAREQGFTLSASTILANPHLSDMAAKIGKISGETAQIQPFSLLGDAQSTQIIRMTAVGLCRVDLASIEDIVPTTTFQMHMIGATLRNPKAYVDQHCFQLPKDLDLDRFRRAINSTVQMAELLRARFIGTQDRRLFQVIMRHQDVDIPVVPDIQDYLQQDQQIPMILGQPLSRFAIVRREADTSTSLVWTIHHAIYDGYSMTLLMDAVKQHYDGSTPRPFTPFGLFVMGPSADEEAAGQKFWTSNLSGVQWARFPAVPPPSEPATAPSPARLAENIPYLRAGTSAVMTTTLIRTAFALVMAPYSENPDKVLFLEALSGRTASVDGIDRVAGPTVKTCPTLVSLDYDSPAPAVLRSVQSHLAERMLHEGFPLMKLLPLWPDFQLRSLLVIQDAALLVSDSELFQNAGTALNMDEADEMPMSFRCFLREGALEVEARYNLNITPQEEMERFTANFKKAFLYLCDGNDTQLMRQLYQGLSR
ncbi:hypothetical protein BX600DRAFT_414908 [Xylariales sp. PMI_506]|nr:hypothetical protein BX600DRAFT_414908 [Xylariales sp. PMI_506]